jgi:putative oxidoreductase
MNAYSPLIALSGRILLAAIFLISGLDKLGHAQGTIAYIQSAGLPAPQLAYVAALVIELGGSLLLILGYRSRASAAVLAAFTLITAFGFHAQFGDQNQMIHFLKNIAITGGLLQVLAFGAGAWALDARRGGTAAGLSTARAA